MPSRPAPDETSAPGPASTPPAAVPRAGDAPATPALLPEAARHGGYADRFPLVALGGSAGSLAAFEAFFRALPPKPGMAFVVLTHLAPDQPSVLAQVLQRSTALPVLVAADGLRTRPNHVYVIPPNRDMSILHGVLLLFVPTQAPGHRLPIDFFLQSLAKDARERAVVVICSGVGADGVLGLKMVVENFGMVMVQDPATAEYDAMPRAALATEFVDYVLPAAELPARLLAYATRPLPQRPRRDEPEAAATATEPAHVLQKIFLLIRIQTGHDFSFYKRNTVFRRIERRMNAHQIVGYPLYMRYLQENPTEVATLFKELLIGVTKFFRDHEAFEHLGALLLPLLRAKPADETVRVWAPGCSTGEEAYSLAMLLLEALDRADPHHRLRLQVFATDLNPDGVETARAGRYPDTIAADVSPERLHRFFAPAEGEGKGKGYVVKKKLRDVLVFATHDLIKDPPFTKLDLLVCRNLLIYLGAELQRTLIPVFHYALHPGGLLLLGPSENLTGFPDLFQPLDAKWKLWRRTEAAVPLALLANFPFSLARRQTQLLPAPGPALTAPPTAMSTALPARRDPALAAQVQRLLLRQYTPPAVLVTPTGDVVYVNGRTGRYLEPAPGLGAMNLFDMARDGLQFALSEAVHQAAATGHDVVTDPVELRPDGAGAAPARLRLTVKPLDEAAPLAGLLLVVFEEQPAPPPPAPALRRGRAPAAPAPAALAEAGAAGARVQALERELQLTRQRLQATIEEMETSVEELKSANEELQSANEELQSTNEEAMTTREEMQSLNEELMTLNVQYLSRTEELGQAANDMKNLLDATDIATVFLDHQLLIKRFTPPLARLMPLRPADVGRPLADFAHTLRYEHLLRDVERVLDRLVPVEVNVQTTAGEWFALRVLPYRTLDNYISGAVLTFTDITALKTLEAQLQATGRFAESIVETMREPLLVLDGSLRVLAHSPAFAEYFGLAPEALKGQPLHELDGGAWNQPPLRERLAEALRHPAVPFENFHYQATFPGAGPRNLLIYGRCITSHGAQTGRLLVGVQEC